MSRLSLAEAASRYCAARERIDALTVEIAAKGRCERSERGEMPWDSTDPGCPGVPSCYEAGPQFWTATPKEQAEEYCDSCRAQVPLRMARYAEKRRLSGLMRTLRVAYRRGRQ